MGRVEDGFMHVALLQMLGEYSVTFLHLHLFLSFLGFVVVICPSLTCSFLCLVYYVLEFSEIMCLLINLSVQVAP